MEERAYKIDVRGTFLEDIFNVGGPGELRVEDDSKQFCLWRGVDGGVAKSERDIGGVGRVLRKDDELCFFRSNRKA